MFQSHVIVINNNDNNGNKWQSSSELKQKYMAYVFYNSTIT